MTLLSKAEVALFRLPRGELSCEWDCGTAEEEGVCAGVERALYCLYALVGAEATRASGN